MQREGPSEPKMVAITKNVKILNNGLDVQNDSSTLETVKADVKVRAGKWFYEAKIVNYGKVLLGWATEDYANTNTSQGIGHDSESWSYDGSCQQGYHGSTGGNKYGEYWNNGDVIGCVLDFDDKKISYYKNGKEMGTAFSAWTTSKGFSPALSLVRRQKVQVNFGKTPFKYPLSEVYPDLHPFYLAISQKQLDELTKVFESHKDTGIKLAESGDTGDIIKGQGMLDYLSSIGVDTDDEKEAGPFLIAWKLNVNHQKTWEFTREEFVGGWSLYGCHDISTMKKKLQEWRNEVKNADKFKPFYNYIFDYIKEDKNVMPLDEAQLMWPMLGYEKWPFYEEWLEYLEKKKQLSMSRDNWRMFGLFVRQNSKEIDPKPDDLWPTLIDEFVEFHEIKTGKRKEEEEEEEEY